MQAVMVLLMWDTNNRTTRDNRLPFVSMQFMGDCDVAICCLTDVLFGFIINVATTVFEKTSVHKTAIYDEDNLSLLVVAVTWHVVRLIRVTHPFDLSCRLHHTISIHGT